MAGCKRCVLKRRKGKRDKKRKEEEKKGGEIGIKRFFFICAVVIF